MKLVFATGNLNKMREIREIMSGLDFDICSMKEAGIDLDIDENAETFEGNALIKARAVRNALDASGSEELKKAVVLADDSGLEIDALGGAPGVYSARFMGEDTGYDIKNAEIIKRLSGKTGKQRAARFRCVIAAVFPDGRELTASGCFEGVIANAPGGENGFGYDPILFLPEYGMTAAQLSSEEKNKISHRGKALFEMRKLLETTC